MNAPTQLLRSAADTAEIAGELLRLELLRMVSGDADAAARVREACKAFADGELDS